MSSGSLSLDSFRLLPVRGTHDLFTRHLWLGYETNIQTIGGKKFYLTSRFKKAYMGQRLE